MHLFFHSPGGQKSKTKVLVWLGSGEKSPLGLQTATCSLCPHMTSSLSVWGERGKAIWCLSSVVFFFFLMWTIFICVMSGVFGHKACVILAPQPRIEPKTPCIGRWSLNHWTTGEVLLSLLIRTLILWNQGPILMISFNLNYLLRGPISQYSHVGG